MARKRIEAPFAAPSDALLLNLGNGQMVDLLCQWNDHGVRCRVRGSISPSTDGSGPWYCSEHWKALRGSITRHKANPGDEWHSIKDQFHIPSREPGQDDEELAA